MAKPSSITWQGSRTTADPRSSCPLGACRPTERSSENCLRPIPRPSMRNRPRPTECSRPTSRSDRALPVRSRRRSAVRFARRRAPHRHMRPSASVRPTHPRLRNPVKPSAEKCPEPALLTSRLSPRGHSRCDCCSMPDPGAAEVLANARGETKDVMSRSASEARGEGGRSSASNGIGQGARGLQPRGRPFE
jgi:hypothetical protein